MRPQKYSQHCTIFIYTDTVSLGEKQSLFKGKFEFIYKRYYSFSSCWNKLLFISGKTKQNKTNKEKKNKKQQQQTPIFA